MAKANNQPLEHKTKIPNRAGRPKPAISPNSGEMRSSLLGGLGLVKINITMHRLNELK